MFWGSFSFSVVASLMPIEDMTNLYRYIDVIERKTFQIWERHFLMVEEIPIVYCPMSLIWKSEDDFQEAKLNVIDWPGNSLDLNPIENLWSIRKSRLQKFDRITMTKLIEAVIQVWHPGLRSQRYNVWLQLRPFQNFHSSSDLSKISDSDSLT